MVEARSFLEGSCSYPNFWDVIIVDVEPKDCGCFCIAGNKTQMGNISKRPRCSLQIFEGFIAIFLFTKSKIMSDNQRVSNVQNGKTVLPSVFNELLSLPEWEVAEISAYFLAEIAIIKPRHAFMRRAAKLLRLIFPYSSKFWEAH